MGETIKFEWHSVEELQPYEQNARKHQAEDIEAIKTSIEEFGFNDPIGIWSDDNLIVEGHGRLIAAKELGLTEVPCIRLDHLTDEQRRAYALAHNKTAELSEWDFDKLDLELAGIREIDMSQFGFNSPIEELEAAEDDFEPIVPDEPITKPGDLYQLGDHRLICGDSTDVNVIGRLMGGQQADMLLTDPPYNVNYSNDAGNIQNDNLEDSEFRTLLTEAFKTASEHLKSGGAFYIWHAEKEGYNFRRAAFDAGLNIRQCLIWNKNGLILGMSDYQWKHEPCLYGWKDGDKHYFTDDRKQATVIEDRKPDFRKMKKEELLNLLEYIYSDKVSTTVIEEKKPLANALHPTMKPITLLARLIRNSSKQGWLVLDTFGGSGSTLIACEQLNRRCYMSELDPHYCDVIVERWEQFTGRKAVLINDKENMAEKNKTSM